MKIVDDKLVLSSGREVYCFSGMIGIDEELDIGYGSDGGLLPDDYADQPWTIQERAELADYMIELWTRYKASIK